MKCHFLRPLPISVLALSAIVALTAGFVWTNRLVLAQYAAVTLLKKTGIAPASLTIDDLTLEGATLKNIVPGTQRIARIDAAYTLSGLRRGRIERLVLSNVQTRARWRGSVLTLPGLTARPGGPGGGAVKTVVIDGYRIVLDTDGGPVTIEGSRAEANFIDGDADIRADATIASALGRIAGRLEATLFGGGEILGWFFVDEGNISAAQGGARALRGVVQLIVGAQGPELDARLDIEGLELGGRKIPTARIAIAATGGLDAIAIDGQMSVPAGQASLRGIVRRSLHGNIRLEGTSAAWLAIDSVKATVKGGLWLARTRGGALSGELDIAAARFGYRALAQDGVTGKAAFALVDSGAPTLDATLEFKRLRVPGADGLPGTISFRLDGQDIAVRGTVGAPNERLAFEVQDAPGKALEFKAKGRLSIGTLLSALESTVEGRGHVAFDIAGNLANPLDLPANPVDALTFNGTIDASLDDIAVPAMFRGGTARGRIGLSLQPKGWCFTNDGLRLSTASLAKEIQARLPNIVQDRVGGGVRLTVSGPASLRIAPRGRPLRCCIRRCNTA